MKAKIQKIDIYVDASITKYHQDLFVMDPTRKLTGTTFLASMKLISMMILKPSDFIQILHLFRIKKIL